MAQHTVPIEVDSLSSIKTNDWENLNDLVQAALASAAKGPITPFGSEITILHHRLSIAGSRLQITSDPSNTLAAFELLVEESKDFSDGLGQASLMDKWIRIVDATDTSIDNGKAVVTVNQK